MPKKRGVCSLDGCDKPHRGHGFCLMHYCRWVRTGDPHCVRLPPGAPIRTERCTVDGCGLPHSMHGYCRSHARRARLYSDPLAATPPRRCTRRDLAERFWEKVAKAAPNGCREWQARRDGCGYGTIKINNQQQLAHRVAWELTHGPLAEGEVVGHRCDNPPCCEPSHLFATSQWGNIADMIRKGRKRRLQGEASPRAKLTEADVRAIRQAAAAGARTTDLSAQFGVTKTMIGYIVRRQAWAHVSP